MRIAVFPNLGKRRAGEIVERIARFCDAREVELLLPPEAARRFSEGRYGCPDIENVPVDMALSIGGDGTLLGLCRKFGERSVPVCGINLGTLGFLADIEADELERRLGQILRQDYRIEKRLLLAAYAHGRAGGQRFLGNAVNDVVLTKSGVARMLRLGVHVNGMHFMDCQADGIIVASPTGSTAYSLSAGGPLMNPTVRALLLTPICAHTFQMRPIVVDERDVIRISAETARPDVIVTLDGQESMALSPGEDVAIQKAEKAVQIVKFQDKDYYQILRNKLMRKA